MLYTVLGAEVTEGTLQTMSFKALALKCGRPISKQTENKRISESDECHKDKGNVTGGWADCLCEGRLNLKLKLEQPAMEMAGRRVAR